MSLPHQSCTNCQWMSKKIVISLALKIPNLWAHKEPSTQSQIRTLTVPSKSDTMNISAPLHVTFPGMQCLLPDGTMSSVLIIFYMLDTLYDQRYTKLLNYFLRYPTRVLILKGKPRAQTTLKRTRDGV